jgi:hypothetical protein
MDAAHFAIVPQVSTGLSTHLKQERVETMARGAYAFRDLDEELHVFVEDERDLYELHHSPPIAKGKSVTSTRNLNGLSESTMLKMYVEHHKTQRRRTILGGALVVGVALLGVAPMLLELEPAEADNALELVVSAPYRSIRVRGDKDPLYDPLARDNGADGQWIGQEPEVGDTDPHDAVEDKDGEATQVEALLDNLKPKDGRIGERQKPLHVAVTKQLRVAANDIEEGDGVEDEP